MQTPATSFLTEEEQRQVSDCVQQAEKQTSGEIVPMIVSTSHSYPLADIIGATFFSVPLSLLGARLIGPHLWVGPDNMWIFLCLFIISFVLTQQVVKRTPRLKQHFLLPRRAAEEVEEGAVHAFFTEKLYKTKAENGILLYISVFERRVCVLGDQGINEKIDHARWQEIVDLVTEGVKNKRQAEAICEAINKIGAILKEYFPIEADDKDELHNLVIR